MPTRNHVHAKMSNRSQRTRSNGGRLRKQAVQVGDDLQQMGTIARDAAQERLDDLQNTASEYYERGVDKMHEVEQSVEEYICRQPVKSVLIAAGIGLVLGRFMMRR
jgi:ElaB/YqjD/DUF883 family membrane-anchored ribosome-binding protein